MNELTISEVAFGSFIIGFVFCMIFNIISSICNYLYDRFYFRKKKKEGD